MVHASGSSRGSLLVTYGHHGYAFEFNMQVAHAENSMYHLMCKSPVSCDVYLWWPSFRGGSQPNPERLTGLLEIVSRYL